jgi:hypothetical protein
MLSSIEAIWNNKLTANEKRTFCIPTTEMVSTGFLTHGNYCGPGNKDLPGSEYSDERFIVTLKLLCMNGLIRNRLAVNMICNWTSMLRFVLKARRIIPSSSTNIGIKRR